MTSRGAGEHQLGPILGSWRVAHADVIKEPARDPSRPMVVPEQTAESGVKLGEGLPCLAGNELATPTATVVVAAEAASTWRDAATPQTCW